MKKMNDAELLEELYRLIFENETTSKERDLLIKAKNDLEKGKYTQAVVSELKRGLAPLARSRLLSKKVVEFYTKLAEQFLERGERGMWIIPTR